MNRKCLSAAFGVVLVGLSAVFLTGARASANGSSRTTFLTFERPVQLPDVSLDAGTYFFELAEPIGARELVRVSSRDQRIVHFIGFTRIVDRPDGMSPEQNVSFAEAPASAVLPITVWWPAGESTGRQFLYPR